MKFVDAPKMWKEYKNTGIFISTEGEAKRRSKKNPKSFVKVKGKKFHGQIRINVPIGGNKRKTISINRMMYELFIGEIPKGYHIIDKYGNYHSNIYSLECVSVSQMIKKTNKMKSKKIICEITGQIFMDADDCARRLNYSKSHIYTMLRNEKKNHLKLKYLEHER